MFFANCEAEALLRGRWPVSGTRARSARRSFSRRSRAQVLDGTDQCRPAAAATLPWPQILFGVDQEAGGPILRTGLRRGCYPAVSRPEPSLYLSRAPPPRLAGVCGLPKGVSLSQHRLLSDIAILASFRDTRRCCTLALNRRLFILPSCKHTAQKLLCPRMASSLCATFPFRRGESVEVIVLPFSSVAASGSRYPLRGTPVTFFAPTEPVAEADWEDAG